MKIRVQYCETLKAQIERKISSISETTLAINKIALSSSAYEELSKCGEIQERHFLGYSIYPDSSIPNSITGRLLLENHAEAEITEYSNVFEVAEVRNIQKQFKYILAKADKNQFQIKQIFIPTELFWKINKGTELSMPLAFLFESKNRGFGTVEFEGQSYSIRTFTEANET
jgi:hypothetical protein